MSKIEDPADFFVSHTNLKSMPDIIYGGPPCQSFSQAGKQKGVLDLRGSLVFDFIRCIDSIKPKAFIMENVSNLKSIANGDLLNELLRSFRELGFNTEAKILTAADYGSPQIRKRVFIIGIRKDIGKPKFPTPTHSHTVSFIEKPYTTVREALQGLPKAKANGDNI